MKIDYYEDDKTFYIVPDVDRKSLCYSYPLDIVEEYCAMHDQTKAQLARELWRMIQNEGEHNE